VVTGLLRSELQTDLHRIQLAHYCSEGLFAYGYAIEYDHTHAHTHAYHTCLHTPNMTFIRTYLHTAILCVQIQQASAMEWQFGQTPRRCATLAQLEPSWHRVHQHGRCREYECKCVFAPALKLAHTLTVNRTQMADSTCDSRTGAHAGPHNAQVCINMHT
jgi:hypothetical protein